MRSIFSKKILVLLGALAMTSVSAAYAAGDHGHFALLINNQSDAKIVVDVDANGATYEVGHFDVDGKTEKNADFFLTGEHAFGMHANLHLKDKTIVFKYSDKKVELNSSGCAQLTDVTAGSATVTVLPECG